ncbi:hypothetical protein BSKO_11590 [Bryopsis sp. KO-2023]|nr:hypothetical protein BSKO_11590 [Bryopsis sp. KO-2023]
MSKLGPVAFSRIDQRGVLNPSLADNYHCCSMLPGRLHGSGRVLKKNVRDPKPEIPSCLYKRKAGHSFLQSQGLALPQRCGLSRLNACVNPVVIPPHTGTQESGKKPNHNGAVVDVRHSDPQKKKEKIRQILSFLFRWLLPVILVGTMLTGAFSSDNRMSDHSHALPKTEISETAMISDWQPTIVAETVLQKAHPSVVSVERFGVGYSRETRLPRMYATGSQTGVVWDDKGHIVAPYRAVKDAAQVKVSFSSGEKRIARMVGYDELNDIAVLQVDGMDFKRMKPVEFNSGDNIHGSAAILNVENHKGRVMMVTSGVLMEEGQSYEARWKPYRSSFTDDGIMKGVLMDSDHKLVGFHDPIGAGGVIGTEELQGVVRRYIR